MEDYEAFSEPWMNFQQRVISDHLKRAQAEWDALLTDYIQKNLLVYGYVFTSKEDWIEFAKTRLTQFTYEHKPNYYEVYLDADSEENKRFIGCYSDKITFEGDGATMKLIIGE